MQYILLLVVLVEGFTTLAMQLVALRHAIPLVGSSIILTSVVIGVILLALAVGYWHGGKLTSRLTDNQIVKVLSRMLLGAGLYYVLLVFPFQENLLVDLVRTMPYIWALFVFSLLFFFLPVAIASHTMPMITQLTQGTKGFAAGKILFVSTIGSFLGSVLTSTVLFSTIGVEQTGYLTAGLLILCHIMLWVYHKRTPWIGIVSLGLIVFLFAGRSQTEALYTHDSPYQKIEIVEENFDGTLIRTMLLNGGYASSIYANTNKSWFGYVRAAEEITDAWQLLSSGQGDAKLLVIGAAGFTYPQQMAERSYVKTIDTIDVDPILKEVTEKHFQRKPLDPKINFVVQSARGFVHDAIEKKTFYDAILVDAYNGTSIPEELVTKEFFADLRTISANIMLNMIMDMKIETPFAEHLMSTLQEAWPEGVRYKDVSGVQKRIGNFIIASRPFAGATQYTKKNAMSVYRDDKHSVEVDKASMYYGYR